MVNQKEKKNQISHLQYADDTILACPKKTKNVKTIKYILRLFELTSGLKVNFKNVIYGG